MVSQQSDPLALKLKVLVALCGVGLKADWGNQELSEPGFGHALRSGLVSNFDVFLITSNDDRTSGWTRSFIRFLS